MMFNNGPRVSAIVRHIVTLHPKARIMVPEDTSVARQRLGKYVPAEKKQCDNAVAKAEDSW
jgi:hypothetical protein